MKPRTIIITAPDHAKLRDLIETSERFFTREGSELRALRHELERAEIVPAEEVPADVITMNSRAELLDLETGEEMELTVVFPADANIEEGRISILAPIGTGMLGYRVGDVFEQTAPNGVRRMRVLAVHFQPEAALATVAA
jgi:regulator of nucleoside diphosphate kinase